MKKIVRLTESDLTRIVKRIVEQTEGSSQSDILNYLDNNFTPDEGWDTDKYMDGWSNGGITTYYVNGELSFVYEFQFNVDYEKLHNSVEDDNFTRLLIGTNVVEKLNEVFGNHDWTGIFADWFIDKTNLQIDEVEYDDFKGIYSDYVDPSWINNKGWGY